MSLWDLVLGREPIPNGLPGLGFHFLEHAMVEYLAPGSGWTIPSTEARFEARIGRPLAVDEEADLLSIFTDLDDALRTPSQTTAIFGLVVEDEYSEEEGNVRLDIGGSFNNDFSADFRTT